MTPEAPLLGIARVTGLIAPDKIQVSFKTTGHGPTYTVRPGYDYADALRVRQKPLPQIGTWGLIAFPGGDQRNGIWVLAVYPSFFNALTTTASGGSVATDPFIDYESQFAGGWWITDGSGRGAQQWPDGSTFTAGYSAVPTTYRNIVDSSNKQQTIPFPQSDRVPNPPGPFVFKFVQATSGAASGQPGTTVTLTSGGSVAVSGVSGQGQTGSITYNGTSLSIDASGNLLINLKSGATTQFTDGGGASDSLTVVSKMVAKFNAHVHTDPQGGNTGTPVTPLASGDISSSIVETQG